MVKAQQLSTFGQHVQLSWREQYDNERRTMALKHLQAFCTARLTLTWRSLL